nr:hypothetical protein Iba_chr02eCG8630 [Ipomoea batatas]GMD38344.1 hypothetical protein Iba_scaffold98017CG0010 [Ipomoea batatas]GME12055.1 hypothetical protein Iba_scaffold13220CG0010 [Ipomoea batatas]
MLKPAQCLMKTASMTASNLSAGDFNTNVHGDRCSSACEESMFLGASIFVETPTIKMVGILTAHSLRKMMKSDKTVPQHLSRSSIITTTGFSQFPCLLCHDAKREISAASMSTKRNCCNKLLRHPPTPFLEQKSKDEIVATWHP